LPVPERPQPDGLAVGGDRDRAVPVGPVERDPGRGQPLHHRGVRMAEAIPVSGRDHGHAGTDRGDEARAAAGLAAVVRDLQDLGARGPQARLGAGLDVPGQQEVNGAVAHVEDDRVVVAGGPGRRA